MTGALPIELVLEFLRAEQAADPYAFRFAPQEYLLRSAGGGVESARFPWDPALLADLEAVRLPGRDPAVVARIGELLRRFVAPLGWGEHEQRLLQAVAAQETVVLTIRSAAAELYALPWELLTIKGSGQHLGELPGVLLRYEWPETKSIAEAVEHPEGGRILFAWSAAAGAVPAAEQLAALQEACRAGSHPFDAARDVLANASCARLVSMLESASRAGEPVALLHLLCHGGRQGNVFGLIFDGEAGGDDAVVVDGGRLRQLLSPFASTLRAVILSACDSGNSGTLGNQLGSVAQTLHRGGIAAIVASRYPLSVAGSIKLVRALYGELLGRPAALEAALLAARGELGRDGATLDWASLQLYARAADGSDTRPLAFRPYRGLLAFQAEHTRFFFGRDAERADTLRKLQALRVAKKPRFLVVAGASGTGKSSVVRSGVIPDLLRGSADKKSAWEVAVLRPGEAPLAALAIALETRAHPAAGMLLVVDQFEEIFTHTRDLAMRRQFVAELWRLAQADSGIDCILTVRVDYLGQCGELVLDDSGLRLDRVAYQEAHQVFVAQMGAAQLRAAIEGPARQVGLELQDGLAARMIDEVEGEPGALPLLSYTLDLLWQKRRGRLLSAQSYAELGGVIGALEGKADSVIDGLPPPEQAQARRILVRLVGLGDGASDTRRRIGLSALRAIEVGRQASFDAVLAAFVDARLLVLGEEQGQVLLEVAHEALIRKWERLRRWIDQDREKLAEIHEVERWVAQWRSYGSLLRDAQLGYALRVLEKHGDDISLDGRDMVHASQRAEAELRSRELEQARQRAEREARAARWLRGTAAVLALSLVGALIAVFVARQKGREARERFLSLLEEQGRQRLLEGDTMRALVYLERAYQDGSRRAATTYPLAMATSATFDHYLFSLVGHAAPVHSVAWSPDGALLITAAAEPAARLWDSRSGRLVRTLLGHSGPIRAVAFSPDSSRVLTSSRDHTTRLWDVKSGQVLLSLGHENDAPRSVGFSPDGTRLVTAGDDKIARLWDSKSGALYRTFTGHGESIVSARFSPDGKQLITASDDQTAKLWDVESGQNTLTLPGHTDHVNAAAFSPDGAKVITASSDKTAKLWDLKTAKVLFSLSHQDSVEDVTFSPDGQRILTASVDMSAKVWDAKSGRLLVSLNGHSGWLSAAVFSPDGRRVATASRDQTARIWDVTNVPILLTHEGIVFSVRPSPDGTRVITGSADKTAQIWDAANGKPLKTLVGHDKSVSYAAFSRDGARIVTASNDKSARVWDAASGKLLMTLLGHSDSVRMAEFSPDGTRILTGSHDQTARIWDATDGRQILILTGHSAPIPAAVFSPDGRQVATVSEDRTLRIWDARTGQSLLNLTGHEDELTSVAYSPDGQLILTGSLDKTARLWDAKSGRQLHILSGHTDTVFAVGFRPDGAFAATGSADTTARIWDTATGQLIMGLPGHSEWVISLAYSPDGRTLMTASLDQTARLRRLIPETRAADFIERQIRCAIPFRFINDQVLPVPTELSACRNSASR